MRAALTLLLVTATLPACKVKDPLFCDETHPCADPSLPYCDLTAAYPSAEGVRNTCIPSPFDAGPVCTPGQVDTCDGDTVHRCNATGTAHEAVQCELGCNTAVAGGCILCKPSQTACTNGTVATCDASGAVTTMHACPLGCFASEPRCTDIDPSNGLAPYLDMTTTVGVDLDLEDGAVIDTKSGTIKDGDGTVVVVPSQLLAAPANGVPVRVFIVKTAQVRGLTVAPAFPPPPALALVSDGAIVVDGLVDLTSSGPGSLDTDPCVGHDGDADQNGMHVSGGGGGGQVTAGGIGASVGPAGGLGGTAFSNPLLVPLRGGCRGGNGALGGDSNLGGGAIQLVSRDKIELLSHAAINAGGQGGNSVQQAGGGGSGGGILLEAPVITFGTGAGIAANGGGGAVAGTDGDNAAVSTQPANGAKCAAGTTTTCADGGRGGAAAGGPTSGSAPAYAPALQQTAGGGGGAAGYIRINTADGTYVKANDAIESPVPSTAKVKTR